MYKKIVLLKNHLNPKINKKIYIYIFIYHIKQVKYKVKMKSINYNITTLILKHQSRHKLYKIFLLSLPGQHETGVNSKAAQQKSFIFFGILPIKERFTVAFFFFGELRAGN